MNNYIPTEVKDLTDSKQRVMRNVMNEIENNARRPKHKWRYVVLTAVLTMSVMLFFLNEILTENEPSVAGRPFPTELHIDLSKPIFSKEQGILYLDGVTLGDSRSKVIEVLGENFTYSIVQEDDNEADFVMDYDGQAKFSFIEDKLNSIVFMNVDEDYFDKLFNDYDGFKFIYSSIYDDRFFYSNETNQILKASTETIDENLNLTLSYTGPHWGKEAEYLYMTQQDIKNQHSSSTNLNVDLAKPTFSEEGYLYLHGVTLGDSPSKVIERLGENYIIGQADGSGSDFLINYDGVASFHFYNDKLNSIVLIKVDVNYFDKLFNDYDGFKFISSSGTIDENRFVYSEETGQIIKATFAPDGNFYVYLFYAGPDLYENADFLKMKKNFE